MKVKILHICNDFSGTKVHQNLYSALDKLGLEQIIYHPLRNNKNIGENAIHFSISSSFVIYSNVLRKYHRILFRNKINFLYKSLIAQNVDVGGVNLQHATTLFSDGALAYKIYRKFGIPYVVTLRNTDINQFLLFRPDLYLLGLRILRNAKQIFFISPSLKKKFYQNVFFSNYEQEFVDKTQIISNGVDDFWLDNLRLPTKNQTNKFLYVGAFDDNKNVIKLLNAFNIVRSKFPDIKLNLVGGGGSRHKRVIQEIENKDWIKYYGKITDKRSLQKIYRDNDFFVMASVFETFGLVYIEALSQGLPVGYTKGQGIDGVFKSAIGERFNSGDVEDIGDKIVKLLNNRGLYVDNIRNIDYSKFRWVNIAEKYFKIYNTLIKEEDR